MVECLLPKQKVEGSNPFARSNKRAQFFSVYYISGSFVAGVNGQMLISDKQMISTKRLNFAFQRVWQRSLPRPNLLQERLTHPKHCSQFA